MPEGTIKKLVSDKGFGFIAGGGSDVFFHHTVVEGASFEELSEGQTVVFESEDGGAKGPRATSVRPA